MRPYKKEHHRFYLFHYVHKPQMLKDVFASLMVDSVSLSLSLPASLTEGTMAVYLSGSQISSTLSFFVIVFSSVAPLSVPSLTLS